jgi:GMP synthase-like glutamine amidotransferase
MVFHWHGDTFDIPHGALHIASSEAFPNQAFLINNRVLGLQFHLEMDRKAIELIIKHAGGELIAAAFVQEKDHIMNNLHYIEQNKNLLFNLLDSLLVDK